MNWKNKEMPETFSVLMKQAWNAKSLSAGLAGELKNRAVGDVRYVPLTGVLQLYGADHWSISLAVIDPTVWASIKNDLFWLQGFPFG